MDAQKTIDNMTDEEMIEMWMKVETTVYSDLINPNCLDVYPEAKNPTEMERIFRDWTMYGTLEGRALETHEEACRRLSAENFTD